MYRAGASAVSLEVQHGHQGAGLGDLVQDDGRRQRGAHGRHHPGGVERDAVEEPVQPQGDAGGPGQADLAGVIALYEDTSGQQDFAVAREQSFMPASQRGTNFGFSRSAWWVRVQLANQGDRDREVLLRQDYPLIDHLDVWTQDANGRWQVVRTGDLRPFSTRPIAHRDFVFPVRLAKGEVRTVYLRYQTSGALNIGLSLASPHQLIENISLEQLAYGAYFGGFGVLFFYNLFIFLTVRDRAFFYYLLYALSYGLYFGVHNGLSFQFLWPDSPIWGNQALLVLLARRNRLLGEWAAARMGQIGRAHV